MSILNLTQVPLSVNLTNKRDLRAQFAALCYRVVKDKPQILLITSRTTKRWILPKGWPIQDLKPADAALTEAWEEAGVKGRAFDQCLGLYSYAKKLDDGTQLPCVVMTYPVKVKSLSKDFPEAKERTRKWFSPKQAAARVDEPELKHILKNFDPRSVRR